MSGLSLKTRLFGSAALALMAMAALPGVGHAQSQPIPPEHYTLDPRGVDLVTGGFTFGTTEVSIGPPGAGGLSYGRVFTNQGWRDALAAGINIQSGPDLLVSAGPISEPFVNDGYGNYSSKYDNGSTINLGYPTVTVTDRYGNVALFDVPIGGDGINPYGADYGLITSHTTPDGQVTTYTYNTGLRCGAWGIHGQCIGYDPIYRLSAVTNNRGYMIKYSYWSDDGDSNEFWRVKTVTGLNLAVEYCQATANSCTFAQTWPSVSYDNADYFRPTTATDQSGRTTTYSYGSTSQIATVRYPGSTSDDVTVAYNASPDFRVNAVTDASGAWTYGYSVSGTTQTTSVAGPLSQSLAVLSDITTGRATSVTDALSHTWGYQYDSDLRVTRVTQPEGDYATYSYDGRSNQTGTVWTPKSGSGLSAVSVATAYPSSCASPVTAATCNRPVSTTDARGAVIDYDWDETTGVLLSTTAPAPTGGASRPQTRIAYNDFQARYHDSSSTFVNGSAIILPVETSACATGTSCDGAANEVLTTVAYPSSGTANNLSPVSVSSGSGAAPTMAVTAMTYTADGDVETVDGPLSGAADTVTYRYDDARQLTGVIGPDPDGGGTLLNRAQRLTYNARGQVTLAEMGTASGGAWTNFSPLLKSQTTYDAAAFSRPVETRQLSADNAVSGVQQVSYDAAGRPSCTVVRMNPATWSSLPSSVCTAATSGSDGPDRITQTTYNAIGRPLTTTSAYGLSEAVTESVTWTANGQTASLTDGNGNVSVSEYDGFDRPSKLRYPNASGGGTSTTDYTESGYDAAGNVVSRRNRAGATTSITYDALNRPTLIDAPSGTMDVTLTYDNLGRVLTSAGNGQTLTNVWDPLSRLTSETGPLGAMSYQFDAAGRMTRITWPDAFYAQYDHDVIGAVTAIRENGATSGAGVLATYAYSNLGQPTGIARGNGAATSYGYDAWGRLDALSHDVAGSGSDVTFGYGYNPAGQITSRTVSNPAYVYAPVTGSASYVNDGLNAVTSAGGGSVTYDANHNITGALGGSYAYDAANRLISTASTSFGYDPVGRLFSVSGAGIRRQYAGQQAVGDYDSVGTMLARYVPGPGLDQPVTTNYGSGLSTRMWMLADERQSVISLTDGSAGTLNINRYDEYGAPASGNSDLFQYTGQTYLAPGLYNYRARVYAPQLGRFLQTDPIGYQAGANLYAYVGADPVNLMDPLGTQQYPGRPTEWFCSHTVDENGVRNGPYFGCYVTQREMVTVQLTGNLFETLFAGLQDGAGGGGNSPLRPSPEGPSDDDDDNERERKIDMNVCRQFSGALASACYQSAQARDFARRNRRPLPPLVTSLRTPYGQEAIVGGVVVLGVGLSVAACVILEPCGALVLTIGGVTALGVAGAQ